MVNVANMTLNNEILNKKGELHFFSPLAQMGAEITRGEKSPVGLPTLRG